VFPSGQQGNFIFLYLNVIFVDELDKRYEALENGSDKGFTVEGLKASIDKIRVKRHGK
jgi:hypothetical protein